MRKLSRKEIFLLKIFIGVLSASALGIFLALTLPQASRLQAQISAYERGISNVKALEINEKDLNTYYDDLVKKIQKEKQSYYTTEERDLTKLGIRMLALIRKNRLTYNRFNKIDSKDGNYLEIALSGNIVNLLGFLGEIYSEPKYLNVGFLTLNNKNGQVKATIRMNYGDSAKVSR